MRVRTAGKQQFAGDTFRRVEVEVKPNTWHTMFGITKTNAGYENDRFAAYTYKTIAEAKKHALKLFKGGY